MKINYKPEMKTFIQSLPTNVDNERVDFAGMQEKGLMQSMFFGGSFKKGGLVCGNCSICAAILPMGTECCECTNGFAAMFFTKGNSAEEVANDPLILNPTLVATLASNKVEEFGESNIHEYLQSHDHFNFLSRNHSVRPCIHINTFYLSTAKTSLMYETEIEIFDRIQQGLPIEGRGALFINALAKSMLMDMD